MQSRYRERKAAVEHLLPCDSTTVDGETSLHPWIHGLTGKSAKEIRTLLEQRWANLSFDCLINIRNRLLEFTPKSIVTYDGNAWLMLERAIPRAYPFRHTARDVVLLPAPPDRMEVDLGFARFNSVDTPLLRSFIEHFGDLRDEIPDYASDFRILKWETLYDYWGDLYPDEQWYSDWCKSLAIYCSCDGDLVLLHPDGQVAWIRLAGNDPPFPIAKDVSGFFYHYAERRKDPWPLDVYGSNC